MTRTKTRLTSEEFARLPETVGKQELVRGEVVEMPPAGEEHGDLQFGLGSRMRLHAERHNLGLVLGETGFTLRTDPDTVRAPDIAFIAAARLSPGGLRPGYVPGAPDLAVEVVSPNDTAAEVDEKVQEYLAAGARRVWVVKPRIRGVTVHYPDGSARTLRGDDVLPGEDVMPGFEVRVGDLFWSSARVA